MLHVTEISYRRPRERRGHAQPAGDTVLVADGQTVVLGGIYETERRETVNKVPFLGDLPGVGAMFRSKQRIDNKAELLIFVTPRILEEGSTIY